ncbi:hypothetical protein GCM10010402_53370 [Actinomadura luteofluorescens]
MRAGGPGQVSAAPRVAEQMVDLVARLLHPLPDGVDGAVVDFERGSARPSATWMEYGAPIIRNDENVLVLGHAEHNSVAARRNTESE